MMATLMGAFDRAIEASWQAGVIVLLVLLLQVLLGRWITARWRCAVWAIVFVRLVLPALPASRLSVLNLALARSVQQSHRSSGRRRSDSGQSQRSTLKYPHR